MGARLAPWRTHVGTVRFRITVLATLVVFVVLTVTGIGLVVSQRELLTDGVDASLRQRADEIESLLHDDPSSAFTRPWGGPTDEDNLTQLVSSDGRILKQSPNIADEARPVAEGPAGPGAGDDTRTLKDLPLDDAFRVLSRTVVTDADEVAGDDGIVVIHVATDIDDIHEGSEVLTDLLFWTIPLVTILLAVVVWWLTGRTLRPVEAIRSQVAVMGGTDLDCRVPEPPTDDEIARLARTMNAMIARVEDAQHRQQRFVADAAHELRTPLTRIRSDLEVDKAHPETADLAATQDRLLEEALGMQDLMDDLLHLARSDAGAGGAGFTAVDVDDLVLREARRLRDRGRVDVDVSGVSAAQTQGDSAQLVRMLRNLADNAERHAGSTVRFVLAEEGDELVLVVADDGPGIPEADRERVFERFTRLDAARSRSAGGAGLGRSIVHEIVARHHGTVRAVGPNGEAGARLEVRLPSTGG